MSFAGLESAILEEAKQRVDSIRDQYEKQYRKEEQRVTAEARELEENIISQAQEKARMEAQRLHQTTQLKAKADILKAKQEELLKTQEEVTRKILAWDAHQTGRLMGALMELMPTDDGGIITAGESQAEIVEQAAQEKGLKVLKKKISGEGGFIFRGQRTEFNLTISHLVDQLFIAHRTSIAQFLFS